MAAPYASGMAYEQKTRPSDEPVLEFLRSVEPARRRAQGLQLLHIFREETGAEPRLWGRSIVGFGHDRFTYATGHSGEMMRVGFSPRKAALTLYGLTLYGSNADLLDRLGKHRVGKGCLYVTKLEDVDLDVEAGRLPRPVGAENRRLKMEAELAAGPQLEAVPRRRTPWSASAGTPISAPLCRRMEPRMGCLRIPNPEATPPLVGQVNLLRSFNRVSSASMSEATLRSRFSCLARRDWNRTWST